MENVLSNEIVSFLVFWIPIWIGSFFVGFYGAELYYYVCDKRR